MKKTAIVILSDPSQNSEEALGRVFNALVLANDLKNMNEDFLVFFQGTGTRWIKELEQPAHPAHPLYLGIKSNIKGASKACASVFKAADDVACSNVPLLDEYQIPGLGGATSLASYYNTGYTLVSF